MFGILMKIIVGGSLFAFCSNLSRICPQMGGIFSVLPFFSGSALIYTMLHGNMQMASLQATGSLIGSIVCVGIYLVVWFIFRCIS